MGRLGLDGAASLLVDAAGRLPGVAAAMAPHTQARPPRSTAVACRLRDPALRVTWPVLFPLSRRPGAPSLGVRLRP